MYIIYFNMERNLFDNVIDSIEKCPNCEEQSYHNWVCESCGIWKVNTIKSELWEKINNTKNNIKDNFTEIKVNFKFNYRNYSSYKLIIIGNKVHEIHFKVNQNNRKIKKFKVIFNYDFLEKEIKETHFQETEKDEREKILGVNKISNIKIITMQPKVKNWYWRKNHPNYYSFLGVNNENLKLFIDIILKEYYNIK